LNRAVIPSDPEVVVVGAGAAGIAAAHRLQALGVSVLVVEGADRIGGRAYTESDSFGIPFDHGCAWLQGPADLPYIGAANAGGFTLIDHADPPSVLFAGGRPATAGEADAYAEASERLRRILVASEKDTAASALFEERDPWFSAAATWLSAMDHGVDFDALSSADVAVYGEYEVNALVKQGLGALVADFANGLPVMTGAIVTSIDWSGSGVSVGTEKGDIRAAAAIVTASTGVLAAGKIRFTPGLPAETQQAFADLPMGLLTKIALQLDGSRFGLPENAFLTRSIEGPLPARAAFFLGFPAGAELCIALIGGSHAWDLEKAGEATAVAFATDQLALMLGNDVRRHVRKGRMTSWASNPLTLGAYAAARPGRHSARSQLGESVGDRIYFAGEALGGAYPALLSGAHLSGDSVARRVAAQIVDRRRS
jgi:monoamine oxidase